MDPHSSFRPRRDPAEQTAGLGLFETPKLSLEELVNRVQIDPPSVPSGASERGADKAKKKAPSQNARIIADLAKAGCLPGSGRFLSRDDLMTRTKMTVNALCGRLGPSGGLLLPKGQTTGPWAVCAVDDAATSNDGGRVLGYQLTDYGLGLIREAGIALMPAARASESAA